MAKFIFIFALIVELIPVSLSTNLATEDTKSQRNPKINVTIYYETLSVETREFFLQQFKPVYDQLWDIIDIDLVPYGRTTARNGSYFCPYGHKQCLANRIQSCAIGLHWDTNEIRKNTANFVYCMFKSKNRRDNIEKSAENCAELFSDQWPAIAWCAKQTDANVFTRHMAEKTKEVTHLLVNSKPVVKINNAYSKKAFNNLVDVVCDAYQQLNANASLMCESSESSDYEKVTVSFYYESLDQRSRNLAINQVKKLFSDSYPSMEESIEIEFIPWGFTNYTDSIGNPFQCAHGYDECYGNRLHACVIDKYENILFDRKQVRNFIICSLEHSEWDNNPFTAGVYCAKKVGFSELWPEINECAVHNSPNNIDIFLKMRDRTQKSSQKLTYVPWININKNHSIEAESDLLNTVCKHYKVLVPEECDIFNTEIPTIDIETTTPIPTTTSSPISISTTEIITTEKPLICNENGEYNGTYGMLWPPVNSGDPSCYSCPLDETLYAIWTCGPNGSFEGLPDFKFCEQWISELENELVWENNTFIVEMLRSITEIDNAIFTPDSLLMVLRNIYDELQKFFDNAEQSVEDYTNYAEHSTVIMSQLINQKYAWSINGSFDIASISNKILDRIRQISFGLGCRENDDQEFGYSFVSDNMFVSINRVELNGNEIMFDGQQHNRSDYSVTIPNHVNINLGVCGNASVGVIVENMNSYVVDLTNEHDQLNSNIMGFFVSNHDGLIELTDGTARVKLENFIQLKFGDKSGCVLMNLTANESEWTYDACSLNADLSNRDVTVCDCTHLGYFAAVIDQTKREDRNLKFSLTYIFAVISILALIFAIAVTIIPSTVRRKSKNIYECNISVCLLILDIILIYGTDRENSNYDYKELCETISILSTYFILSCFCWILVESYEIFRDLVFIFYGKLRISLIFAYIIGYFVPLVIVAIDLILVDLINELSMESFIGNYFCFFTIYESFWLILVPVLVIILLILFLLIIGLLRVPTKKDVLRIVYSSTFTIYLVITWIIYILYIIEYGAYLYYIFIIFKTFLSLMIGTEKILLDKGVRQLMRDYLKCNCKRNKDDLLANEFDDNEKHGDYGQNLK